jgi:hypothetical protein
LIGLIAAAGMASGCKDQPVRDYLGQNGGPKGMYAWETYVNAHLCLLEKYSTMPNNEKKCAVPPSVTPPPSYPPK